MSWSQHIYPDAAAFGLALASALQAEIRVGLATRGRAALALAGGQTPLPVYRQLATAALEWSRVVVVPTDERWVASDHRDCNSRALREAFDRAEALQILPLTPSVAKSPAAPEWALKALASVNEPFDAVLLGMGTDGHVASLFPGAAELSAGLDRHNPVDALVVNPDPLPLDAPFARISLGIARLSRTRRLLLAVTGEAKRAVLHRATAHSDPLALPVCALLHDPAVQVEIHWCP